MKSADPTALITADLHLNLSNFKPSPAGSAVLRATQPGLSCRIELNIISA